MKNDIILTIGDNKIYNPINLLDEYTEIENLSNTKFSSTVTYLTGLILLLGTFLILTGCAISPLKNIQETISMYSQKSDYNYIYPENNDDIIAMNIKRSLNSEYSAYNSKIFVFVKEGHVILSGYIDSNKSRENIEKLVTTIPGVISVDNNLRNK